MSNTDVKQIIENIKQGVLDTAIDKDNNSPKFPTKNFSGFCLIRQKSDPFQVEYRLRINYGKPVRLCIKTTSIQVEKSNQDLNLLWNVIAEIETKKRQK